MHETAARDHDFEMLYCNEKMAADDSGGGVETQCTVASQPQCTIGSQRPENDIYGVHDDLSASLTHYEVDRYANDGVRYNGVAYAHDDLCYEDLCYDDLCYDGMAYDELWSDAVDCSGCCEEVLPLGTHVVRADQTAAGVANTFGMQWETVCGGFDVMAPRVPLDQGSVRKHKVMQVCANSMAAHRQDVKLEDSTHKLRARCVKKIEQALYYSRFRHRGEPGVEIVNETSGINAVLMMEWLTRHQTEYFITAGCDIISSVCLLQNARSMQVVSMTQTPGETEVEYQTQKSELYKTMALCVFDTPKQYSEATIQYHLQLLQAFIADEYIAIDFSTFMEVYYTGQTRVQQKMTNFLFVFMKNNTAPRQVSMYEIFVEIVLRESEDIETQQEIFFDYTCLMAQPEGVQETEDEDCPTVMDDH